MSNQKTAAHIPSILQLIFSLAGIGLLWSLALLFYGMGLYQFVQGVAFQQADLVPFVGGSGMAFFGLLLLPSAWYALSRLRGDTAGSGGSIAWSRLGRAIWLWPLVLLAGYGAVRLPGLAWIFLPFLHVLALGIPILWFISLGGRGLQGISRQSVWGVFAAGLLLGPFLILLLEVLLAAVLIGIILALVVNEPGFSEGLRRIWEQVSLVGQPSLPEVMQFLEIYLLPEPAVLVLGLVFVALVIPLLEELLKPVGMLFLDRRKITPAAGFIAGMLSGAAFALFESIFQIAAGDEWVLAVVGRMGTSLVHILNSGLVGWGLALAWREKRYGRLFFLYLIAVTIHALWNGITAVLIVGMLPQNIATFDRGVWAVAVLPLIALACFLALIAINRYLIRTNRPDSPQSSLPEESEISQQTVLSS